MAGIFYSLKETAARLNLTEQEVRQISREGKLREFRDGTNILFKVDEVEALAKQMAASGPPVVQEQTPEPEPVEPVPQAPADELVVEQEAASEEGLRPEELESLFATEPEPEGAPIEQEQAPVPEEDIFLAEQVADETTGLSDTVGTAAPGGTSEEDILLASDATKAKDEAGLDTTISNEGVKVVDEGDKDHKLTDDTLAETLAGLGAGEESSEASLEEIEKDVNLDTFGSGSGLLDLSLQADDTSLGGVLDEIYAPEGQKEAPAEPAEVAAEVGPPEEVAPAVDLGVAAAPVAPVAMPVPVVEDPADPLVAGLLGLSLVVATYTLVATVSAHLFGATPGLVEVTKQFIVYAIGGLGVVALVLSAMVFLKAEGPTGRSAAKPKKEKKAKKAKDKPAQ
ncbi:MAG: hypothetical protein QHH07_03195 [Sedimentisphaerales bacterium]|jgi:excisionase family DNA binding protein|nr:hypothetical protein [Sedimentisphaerales bacterium]